jgi:hypothetical protein
MFTETYFVHVVRDLRPTFKASWAIEHRFLFARNLALKIAVNSTTLPGLIGLKRLGEPKRSITPPSIEGVDLV